MAAVWLEYDQEALDAQYNNRLAVPTVQNHFDNWKAWSAGTREALNCRLNQSYGRTGAEKLNIFPAPRGNAPIQLFVHGGYWQSMDKSDFDYIAEGLAPLGANVLVVNYGLAPNVGMDDIVRQIRSACAWAWRNAKDFNGDPNRIFISGHSAGAHLAAMAALTDWQAFDPDLPPDLVKGACCVSGIYELEPIRLSYLNANLQLDPQSAARNSPLQILREDKRRLPPASMVLCVGGDESAEFKRQQEAFGAAWTGRGLACEVIPRPGLHHFNVIDELADLDSPLNLAVLRQMGL